MRRSDGFSSVELLNSRPSRALSLFVQTSFKLVLAGAGAGAAAAVGRLLLPLSLFPCLAIALSIT